MQMEKENLAACLSFRRITDEEEEQDGAAAVAASTGSPDEISNSDRTRELDEVQQPEEEYKDLSSGDFEFSFMSRDPETITADDIFSNGQIRPVYPVFNRDLLFQGGGDESDDASSTGSSGFAEKAPRLPLRKMFIEERDLLSSSSSESDEHELETVPEDTYCVWTPRSMPASPDLRKKSNSTTSSRRWRLRDLVIGRSHSDGDEKFLFLAAPPVPRTGASEKKLPERRTDHPNPKVVSSEGKKAKGRVSEMDMVTAHRLFYSKGGNGGDRRRSFLPYRKNLVGFFGNVNGLNPF